MLYIYHKPVPINPMLGDCEIESGSMLWTRKLDPITLIRMETAFIIHLDETARTT
jgi:hypothetical protein